MSSSLPGLASPSVAGFAARFVGVDDRLLAHVPCEKCGYDLRGALASSTCPECGTLVGVSLEPDRLVFADAAWLARVRNGLDWCLGGSVAGVILGVIMLVTLAATGATNDLLLSALIEWCFGIPPGLAIALGIWRLTTPEPGNAGPLDIARVIARGSAMFTTLCAVLTLPVYVMLTLIAPGYNPGSLDPTRPPDAAVFALAGLGGLGTIAFGFGTLVYARPIARRARSIFVSGLNLAVTWCCAILCIAPPIGIGMTLGLAAIVTQLKTGSSSEIVGIGGAIVLFMGLLVWLILLALIGPALLVLALGYRRLLAVAAKRAAAMYAGESSAPVSPPAPTPSPAPN